MMGCNGFGLERFTDEEINNLVVGRKVGDRFTWRGEVVEVVSVDPFECHCLWDIETPSRNVEA